MDQFKEERDCGGGSIWAIKAPAEGVKIELIGKRHGSKR